jgi:hypothetical protein
MLQSPETVAWYQPCDEGMHDDIGSSDHVGERRKAHGIAEDPSAAARGNPDRLEIGDGVILVIERDRESRIFSQRHAATP